MISHHTSWSYLARIWLDTRQGRGVTYVHMHNETLGAYAIQFFGLHRDKDGRVALRQKCDARLGGDIAVIITAITAIFDICIESQQSRACLTSDHTQHFAYMGRGVPGLAPALYI